MSFEFELFFQRFGATLLHHSHPKITQELNFAYFCSLQQYLSILNFRRCKIIWSIFLDILSIVLFVKHCLAFSFPSLIFKASFSAFWRLNQCISCRTPKHSTPVSQCQTYPPMSQAQLVYSLTSCLLLHLPKLLVLGPFVDDRVVHIPLNHPSWNLPPTIPHWQSPPALCTWPHPVYRTFAGCMCLGTPLPAQNLSQGPKTYTPL